MADEQRWCEVRVLVVSEDARERLRAVTALQLQDDVEVVEADSGPAARELLAGEPFDVLVVDGDLYPKGGFALLYGLRAQAELEGVDSPPAVVLGSRTEDRWLADWAGANEVMLKPVEPFGLARKVVALAGVEAAPRDAVALGDRQVEDATRATGSAGLTPGAEGHG